MKKTNIGFIKSAFSSNEWINDDIVEVAFVGRSNVGKSSLINSLAKKKIAIVSKTPGRTQLANFYGFNNFRIIDLPGYGYAKASKFKKDDLIKVIDNILLFRKNLFTIYLICDINVVTKTDLDVYNYLSKKFKHLYIVLNKADRYSLKFYKNNLTKISHYFNVGIDKFIITSTFKNLNINFLLNHIKQTI